MRKTVYLPVFNISNFEDYNNCMGFVDSFYIRSFREHVKDNKFIEKPHRHDFYLILLVTKGFGTHLIDEKTYQVKPGSFFIVCPGQVHSWNLSKDIDGYVMFFKKDYFLLDYDHDSFMSFPFLNRSFNVPCLQLEEDDFETILNLHQRINEEYQVRQISFHEMIRLLLSMMFVSLLRIYANKNLEKVVFTYDLIQYNRFECLVDQYYKGQRTLIFYADKMSISLKQLGYLCKKMTGRKPSEIILNRLVLEAKRFIVHTTLSINAIAEELNYEDTSYFIRFFKKMTGCTPEQYRQNLKDRA